MRSASKWAGLVFLVSIVGCGDDDGGGSGTGASGTGGSGTGATGTGATSSGGSGTGGAGASSQGGSGGAGASGGAAGGSGGGACYDPGPLDYDVGPGGQDDCLTFAGASSLCGFSSDDSICEFAVACGASDELGQCKINCEMGVTVVCNSAMDVDCLIAAMCNDDCGAIAACGFIL